MPATPQMEQNFANHTKQLPPLYMAAFLVLAANFLWALWTLIRFPTFTTALVRKDSSRVTSIQSVRE